MSLHAPRPLEGSHEADAILFEASLLGASLGARVLAALADGATAYRLGDDVLVCFATRRRLRVERAGGTLLVRRGRVLRGFDGVDPCTESASVDTVAWLSGGEVEARPLASLEPVAPRDLLEAPTLDVFVLPSLGAPKAIEPRVARDASPSMRTLFAIEARPEQRAFMASLDGGGAPGARSVFRDAALGIVRRIWTRVASVLAGLRREPTRRALGAGAKPAEGSSALSHGPSLFDRALAWFSHRLAFLERLTGRQSRYLEALLTSLDEGDFDEALRRAIPLGGKESQLARLSLGVPTPRAALHIEATERAATTTFPLEKDAEALLREHYERAFRALDKLGRHEDAAFVLAELLRAHERAVDYLEQHDVLALAAEVAEARGLAPARVVELWFRAGDRARAIAVARRTGAFLMAIERLERRQDPAATALRLEYADVLASSGDRLRAVEIAWPVREARALCREWLEIGMRAGGIASAKSWARFLALTAPDVDDVKARLVPALRDRSEDGAQFRATFAAALADPLDALGARALAEAYRGLLEDRHVFSHDIDALIRNVERRMTDVVLVADAPRLTARPQPTRSTEPLRLGPLDVGTFDVVDALRLPDGRTLVALGEHGARIVGRNGTTETRFAHATHGIALDDRGERAILVGARRDVLRLARLDLLSRRLDPWIETDAYVVAGTFDGESLYVARGDAAKSALVCLDVLANEPHALFTVSGLDGSISAIHRDERSLEVVVRGPSDEERFTFDLPSRVLRRRDQSAGWSLHGGNLAFDRARALDRSSRAPLRLTQALTLSGEDTNEGVEVTVTRDVPTETQTLVTLANTSALSLRVHGRFVTLADDQGRVVALERESLAVVSSFTVS